MPILALIGIVLVMMSKRDKKKAVGAILLGFSVLMVGMDLMADAVAGLKDSESFRSILTMFENPIMGVLAGLVLTAIVQSSSASVGILQSLTTTGAITFGAAIPIVMGQNIGTCVTAMISSVGATKNGKRAALAHLYFNIISVVVWLSLFYLADAIVDFSFMEKAIDMWGVAFVHTFFKVLAVALIAPFAKYMEKLAVLSVRDKDDESPASRLDERLLATPAVGVQVATEVVAEMAEEACSSLIESLSLLDTYDTRRADAVRASEGEVDKMEDALGTYLVKLGAQNITDQDSHAITMLLHIIGDFERISDHAVNVVESAEELRDKKLSFSAEANRELGVLRSAVSEILRITSDAFTKGNMTEAAQVEPLEEVVDDLRDAIKRNHVLRLQKNECSIEHGFILSDLLTNLERVADHCSNIAGCILEITQEGGLEMHKYLASVREGGEEYNRMFAEYSAKYAL